MSDFVWPHRQQPTRLPCPWDSPGKNTGVGCHFLLRCMKVKSEREVAQSCPPLWDPMDCRPPGSSVHGILQARTLEWGAIALKWQWLTFQKTYRRNHSCASWNILFCGHDVCLCLVVLFWIPWNVCAHEVLTSELRDLACSLDPWSKTS